MSRHSNKNHAEESRGNPSPKKGGVDAGFGGSRVSGEREPVMGQSWSPLWLVAALGLAVYWGQLYLDRHAGGFDSRVYEPFASFAELDARQPKDEAQIFIARGKVAYEQACAPCHQPTGLGLPGQFPPLAESDWVNAPGAGRLIRIALHGLGGEVTVKGQKWNGAMPGGIGETLSENDLAAAISYVRQAWGNKAALVKPADVKAVKGKTAGRGQPWTAQELLGLADSE